MATGAPYVLTVEGSLHVVGDITSGGKIVLPAGSVTSASVEPAAEIEATKTEQRQRLTYSQESATTTVSETKTIHVVYGTTGTLRGFRAGSIVANVGAATITVDLKKNGVSMLSAVITLNNSHTARQVVAAALASSALVAGDVLEITVVATAGGGTLGKGVFAEAIVDELPT